MSRFADDVIAFRKALVGGDASGVRALLARGVEGRGMLPGKHGGEAADFVTVSVVIEDAPGQLAALFQRAGGPTSTSRMCASSTPLEDCGPSLT